MPMQDAGELAGERHLGALHAAAPGDRQRPALQAGEPTARVSITLAAS